MTRVPAFALALGGLLLFAVSASQAASGRLDPTFGTSGFVTTSMSAGNDAATAAALQPDGKIVVAGVASVFAGEKFAVARYNPDGSLDQSFGTEGKVTTAIGVASLAFSVALQPDGKIIVAGVSFDGSRDQFALARYEPDGSLDSSFGVAGKVTTTSGTIGDELAAVVLQRDGKILAAGTSGAPSGYSAALLRYQPDGSLDPSFGTDGVVMTNFGLTNSNAIDLAIQPDDKIVVGGLSEDDEHSYFALARYGPNGSLDQSFGASGKVTTAVGQGSASYAITLQPNGKIVAAGEGGRQFALARYMPNGSLDTNFGVKGLVSTSIGAESSASAIALDSSGRILLAGYSYDRLADQLKAALARYRQNGSLDQSFGTGGTVTTAAGTGDSAANSMLIQTDGKIVVAGLGLTGAKGNFFVARYLAGPDCLVPDVRRKRLAKARQKITHAHCSVGRIALSFSRTISEGRVVAQRPAPHQLRTEGAKVKLVVSKGKRKRR